MGIFDPASLPSGPTSQEISNSGIAAWAQPYIMNYLNQAQGLMNQGPTDLQNQVYSSAANMGMPSQFGQGSGLLNQAGQGMLGTTGTALGYGQQASGAGAAYQQMATDPSQMAAYMNPYVQQALAPQLQLLNQQQALQGQKLGAQAAGQGAFGGNRAALAQGLNAQNYALAGQQAIGQGYSDAFKQAQQAQQFGSELGLRGLQTALQGVDTAQRGYAGAAQAGVGLGNIGAQQGQYDVSRLGLQNQIANQQYNLPFQRLQFMQGMMSGLPISSQTRQGWQAGPSKFQQAAGLGTTVVGGIGALDKAGAFDYMKKWWNNGGGSGGSYMENPMSWADNSDMGQTITDLSGASYADLPYDMIAKGGQITNKGVKQYADGGDVKTVGMDGISSDMGMTEFLRTHPQEAAGIYAPNLPSRPNTLLPIGAGFPSFTSSPQQDNSAYLNSLYSNYLGRQADEAGFKHNLDLLNSGKIDQQGLANAFMNSAEAQGMPRLMGAGLSGAGRNAINASINPSFRPLMQMRPTDQENYTGFGPTAGGPLNQIRLSDQENYTGFGPTAGGALMQLRPTEQENYTGFDPVGSGLTDIRLNQLLGTA